MYLDLIITEIVFLILNNGCFLKIAHVFDRVAFNLLSNVFLFVKVFVSVAKGSM